MGLWRIIPIIYVMVTSTSGMLKSISFVSTRVTPIMEVIRITPPTISG
ncbi:MAG: hypothetical protein QI199_00040 [Candidatus Korarchaeota archaeon]|nr:hypothetical protein [Candidatus Korarchaeota archaeon]